MYNFLKTKSGTISSEPLVDLQEEAIDIVSCSFIGKKTNEFSY